MEMRADGTAGISGQGEGHAPGELFVSYPVGPERLTHLRIRTAGSGRDVTLTITINGQDLLDALRTLGVRAPITSE
jgi:hypothetical protein